MFGIEGYSSETMVVISWVFVQVAFALYCARRRRVRFDPERKFAPFWTPVQSSALPNLGPEVAGMRRRA